MTPQQRQLYDYVAEYWRRFGYGPSYGNICAGLGLRSRSSITGIARPLIAAGYLAQDPHRFRSLRIAEPTDRYRAALVRIGEFGEPDWSEDDSPSATVRREIMQIVKEALG